MTSLRTFTLVPQPVRNEGGGMNGEGTALRRWLLERAGRATAPAIAADEAPADMPRAPEERAPGFTFEPDEEEMFE